MSTLKFIMFAVSILFFVEAQARTKTIIKQDKTSSTPLCDLYVVTGSSSAPSSYIKQITDPSDWSVVEPEFNWSSFEFQRNQRVFSFLMEAKGLFAEKGYQIVTVSYSNLDEQEMVPNQPNYLELSFQRGPEQTQVRVLGDLITVNAGFVTRMKVSKVVRAKTSIQDSDGAVYEYSEKFETVEYETCSQDGSRPSKPHALNCQRRKNLTLLDMVRSLPSCQSLSN